MSELKSVHLIEKDKNGLVLNTWSYPEAEGDMDAIIENSEISDKISDTLLDFSVYKEKVFKVGDVWVYLTRDTLFPPNEWVERGDRVIALVASALSPRYLEICRGLAGKSTEEILGAFLKVSFSADRDTPGDFGTWDEMVAAIREKQEEQETEKVLMKEENSVYWFY